MVVVGLTVMAAVVAPPGAHEYVPPPLAVKVALAPSQIIPSLAVTEASVTVIDAVGNALTVMVAAVVAVHPFAFVTVTVYVAVLLGDTDGEPAKLPGCQLYEIPPVALNVDVPP